MVLDQYEGIHRLHHTFILYKNIPRDRTSKLLSANKVSRAMNFPGYIYTWKISDTTLIMSERRMYSA